MKKIIKKLLITLIISLVILSFGACYDRVEPNEINQGSENQDEQNLQNSETDEQKSSNAKTAEELSSEELEIINQFLDSQFALVENDKNSSDELNIKIIDYKIKSYESVAAYDDIADGKTYEIVVLDYLIKPHEDSKEYVDSFNSLEEDGWYFPSKGQGRPCLIFQKQGDNSKYLGFIYEGKRILEQGYKQESALRTFLEEKEILTEPTYEGEHVIVKFPIASGEIYQAFLSQPINKGEGGIWCVERDIDTYGNITISLNMPYDIKDSSHKYYAGIQSKADKGEADEWLDYRQVALVHAKLFGAKNLDLDDLEFIKDASLEDFKTPPTSALMGYLISLEDEIDRKYMIHQRIREVKQADNGELEVITDENPFAYELDEVCKYYVLAGNGSDNELSFEDFKKATESEGETDKKIIEFIVNAGKIIEIKEAKIK